jgi:hypothetical protein
VGIMAYRAGFKQSCSNAHDGYEENTGGVVVVFVEGPENKTGNLKYIERMKCLL